MLARFWTYTSTYSTYSTYSTWGSFAILIGSSVPWAAMESGVKNRRQLLWSASYMLPTDSDRCEAHALPDRSKRDSVEFGKSDGLGHPRWMPRGRGVRKPKNRGCGSLSPGCQIKNQASEIQGGWTKVFGCVRPDDDGISGAGAGAASADAGAMAIAAKLPLVAQENE